MECSTITIEEAATILGIGRNKAYALAVKGQIPALRFGKLWRVPVVQLEQFIATKTGQVEEGKGAQG